MDLELTGRKAFISGSTAGIGLRLQHPVIRYNGAALRVDGGVVKACI